MCPVPPSPVFRDQDATHAADFDNRGDRGKEGGVGSARLKGVKKGVGEGARRRRDVEVDCFGSQE